MTSNLYRSSNQVFFESQRLKEYFDSVFEISLNASLLSDKIKLNPSSEQALITISQKLGTLSIDLKEITNELFDQATSLSKFSLAFSTVEAHRKKLLEAKELVHNSVDKSVVEKAIHRFSLKMGNSCKKSLEQIKKINIILDRLTTLVKKVWISINNMKIEMAQEDGETDYEVTANELEEAIEKVKESFLCLEKNMGPITDFAKSFLSGLNIKDEVESDQ
ncbi:MAG: hypothetical protein ACPGJV_06870 [Bacteriovoracaceae bacterium]